MSEPGGSVWGGSRGLRVAIVIASTTAAAAAAATAVTLKFVKHTARLREGALCHFNLFKDSLYLSVKVL